jgi:arylsulfatase A-like enzyme
MHIERRRLIRRAIAGGVLFSALSVLPLFALELSYVTLFRHPSWGSLGEMLRFVLYLFLLLVSAGAVFGIIEGLVVLGLSQLTALLAKRRVTEPRWMAWLASILMLPGIAVVTSKLFAGRRAQLIFGKDFIAITLGLFGLLAMYGLFRAIISVRDRFRIRRWGPRQAALIVPSLLLAAGLLYLGDQTLYPRLYFYLHVVLTMGALAACQLAAGATFLAFRPRLRWMGQLAEPSIAIFVVLAGVAGAAWSLSRISTSETLRFLYYEHSAIQSKILELASSLRLLPQERHLMQEAEVSQSAIFAKETGPLLRNGPRQTGANIVLISVDAMRADHMQTYGYPRPVTPALDTWAKTAAVFERGYSQVPHTSFSVTSLMTGSYIYSLRSIDPGHRYITIAETLRRYGYKTGGFFPPAIFYIDHENFTAFESSKFGFEYVKYEFLEAQPRIDQVLSFLQEEKDRHVFVWIHFFEPHEPYDRHPGFDFGPRAVDRYDGEIAYVDAQIGRLLTHIKQKMPNTFIALTADHGEEFGEHGGHYHGNALYEQQIRVPLIISGPGIAPRRIQGDAQVIDLPVTLLALADLPLVAGMRGTDLGPWLAGEDPKLLPPIFSEIEQKKVVISQGKKLVCDTKRDFCELYDLLADPGESRNLVASQPALAARLRRQLMAWMASHVPQVRDVDKEAEMVALLDRGRQKDPGVVPDLIKLTAGPLAIRREAIQLLTEMRTPAAKEALVKASGDSDPGVRDQALVGAALLGQRGGLEQLQSLLQRPDLPPAMRRDAYLAQARAGDRRATIPLARILDGTTDIYQDLEIIEALGNLGDAAAAPTLMHQLQTLRARLYSIEALGKVGARIAVPELIKSLREDSFISWRKAAAHALGLIGDRQATSALRVTVVQDLEADVVAEALAALRRLHGLPFPGVAVLKRGSWICAKGSCTMTLNRPCEEIEGQELLLLGPPSDAVREPAAVPGSLAVRCAGKEGARVNWSTRGTEVIHLPGGLKGTLQLQSPEPPPTLELVALRPLPQREK